MTVRLRCAVTTSDKFIVQLSAVLIRQAGPAQNTFVSRSWRFSKGWRHFRWIFDREGGIAHQPLLVSENYRVIDLSCGLNIRSASFSFVTIHASDRQTDGQTDGQNYDSNTVRCITCNRTVKISRTRKTKTKKTVKHKKSGKGKWKPRHIMLQTAPPPDYFLWYNAANLKYVAWKFSEILALNMNYHPTVHHLRRVHGLFCKIASFTYFCSDYLCMWHSGTVKEADSWLDATNTTAKYFGS